MALFEAPVSSILTPFKPRHGFAYLADDRYDVVMMSWWKHAFAVEPEGPLDPTPEQRAVVDEFCTRIVERGLALPAILFLESSRPLGPLAAQSLLLLQPWFELALPREQLALFTKFLDRRGSFDFLCQRLETLSAAPLPSSPATDRSQTQEA